MNFELTHLTDKCVVCDSEAGYVQLATLQQAAILCCKRCGTHSINPPPDIKELMAAYQDFDAGKIARQEFDDLARAS